MLGAGGREECVMALIVQKFGGTSVKDAERLNNVADIVTSTYKEGNDVVVVVSAQGDTTDDLIAKAAEINDRPSKREMDMLLSSGEQISAALLAMAIERMGYPVVSLLIILYFLFYIHFYQLLLQIHFHSFLY